ncbi:MAG TPA: serine/threonine-protein kinase [Kofleriaceae bacterium]|nr:serine/threonine-protein kinase [Kofleriaceae bacterium]
MAISSVESPFDDRQDRTLRPGELISAYRIDRLVGAGGMGAVYRAEHVLSSRVVALKVLREEQIGVDRSVDRMMREASILASVSHPGLPQFFECGLLDDGRPWIAMELIDGEPLHAHLQLGPLPPDEVIALLGSVAEVLAAAHGRSVTHRDLKPDNIVLTPGDSAFPVRVIDWGIAHHLAGTRFTSMNEAVGTPTYMAPEQARGGPTGGHCDIYGLGVVAYQAMTGRPPFLGQSSVEILVQHLNRPVPPLGPRCPDAPMGLVELVESMLLKNYEGRPTAGELLAELRSLELAVRDEGGVPTLISDDRLTPVTAQLRAPRPF